MINLQLEADEGIVLQSKKINFFGEADNETEIIELILTNKNLICVVDKGWFKTDIVIEKIPISNIRVVDDKPQVIETVAEFGDPAFQILLNNGQRMQFIFDNSDKNEIKIWIGTINNVINGINEVNNVDATPSFVEPEEIKTKNEVQLENPQKTGKRKNLFGGLAGALGSLDIQLAMDKAQEKIEQFANQVQEEFSQVQQQKFNYNEPQVQTQQQPPIPPQQQAQPTYKTESNVNISKTLFCSNCGTKLNEGAKFCHGCGSAVETVTPQPIQPPPPIPREEKKSERQQEYVGKVLKCPHCGGVINETTAICPECGLQITGRAAVSSVQAFKEQLMAIESHRRKSFGGMLGIYNTADPADKQKLTLIRNFPIPNSVDDILEFMLLAIANIDVKLSKKTWANSGGNLEVLAIEMPRVISNAWVSKMEQCYKKAEIAFPNDPAFSGIRKMYLEKMKELKIKVE